MSAGHWANAGIIVCRGLRTRTVHAKERLEIKESGSVVGDIYTSCLLVDPGGFFDGQCHMPAPEPAIPAPIGVDSQEHI